MICCSLESILIDKLFFFELAFIVGNSRTINSTKITSNARKVFQSDERVKENDKKYC